MKLRQLLSYTSVIIFLIGFVACSDNGSSDSDKGSPPSIPDLTAKIQPDISFFQNNNPQTGTSSQISANEYSNFTEASLIVTLGTFFASSGQLYLSFINPAYNNEAEFKDGHWEWSYNYSAEGQGLSVRFTASEVDAQSTKWAMFISYDDGQGGGYQNYQLIDGTTSDDGAEGSWTFNTFADGSTTKTPAVNTHWVFTSETEKTITTDIYDEGKKSNKIIYEESDSEHTMTFDDLEDLNSEDQVVFWNSNTKTGYMMDDGSKTCWDENLQNAPCN